MNVREPQDFHVPDTLSATERPTLRVQNDAIDDVLTRGVVETVVEASLRAKLSSGKMLRVKHGVDPTTNRIHLGYAAIYLKLRDLMDLGHTIVFLIGGFTARFGDPTDKLNARSMRSKEEVQETARTYLGQIARILDTSKIEVRNNSEWYDEMSGEDMLRLMSQTTTARMLERDMFQKRMAEGLEIGLHELVYPLLQGYDSVKLASDVTVIGNDQKFNELQARPLQLAVDQKPQDLIMMKLLVGTDGTKKMSQSLGNDIAIDEAPNDMFGKIMSIPDLAIPSYFELVTRVPMKEVQEMEAAMRTNELNPRDAKVRLAKEIVTLMHSAEDAEAAADHFDRVFRGKELPEVIEEKQLAIGDREIIDLLVETGLAPSKNEARRLIIQSGVRIDDRSVKQIDEIIPSGTYVLRVGKRRFLRVTF